MVPLYLGDRESFIEIADNCLYVFLFTDTRYPLEIIRIGILRELKGANVGGSTSASELGYFDISIGVSSMIINQLRKNIDQFVIALA
jgi:hypothetical protein